MSTTEAYLEALHELLDDDDGKHQLSVALVSTTLLSKTEPELFAEPLFPNASEQTNLVTQIIVGALHALTRQGLLPEDDTREGTIAALKDQRIKITLTGTILELLKSIESDAELMSKLEASDTPEEAVEAVANSALGQVQA